MKIDAPRTRTSSLFSKTTPPLRLKLYLEDVVPLGAENHDALVEMVVLHRRRRVEEGQRRVHLRLERVVRAAMVEIVAEARHEEAEDLKDGCEE